MIPRALFGAQACFWKKQTGSKKEKRHKYMLLCKNMDVCVVLWLGFIFANKEADCKIA